MLGEYGADLELNTATRKVLAVVHELRKHIAIQYSSVTFGAEVPGSSFFDSGSETIQSRNSVPIPILRLSMARTQFRFRVRDCTGLELDSDSGSETAQA